MKYHISKKTGEPTPCEAEIKCPLGGEHFADKDEAYSFIENQLKNRDPYNNLDKYFSDEKEAESKVRERKNKEQSWIRTREYRKPEEWEKWQEENPGLGLTPVPGAKNVHIFRAGSNEAATYAGETGFYADLSDFSKPEDFPNRHGSLYASSDIKGLARWTRANYSGYGDSIRYTPHSFSVDPNSTYIFNISAWEDYSWHGAPPERFWDSAMLLSRFQEVAEKEGWDTTDWEILVPPEKIEKYKPMGTKTFLSKMEEVKIDSSTINELKNYLRRR